MQHRIEVANENMAATGAAMAIGGAVTGASLPHAPSAALVEFMRALARRQARIDASAFLGCEANDNQPPH